MDYKKILVILFVLFFNSCDNYIVVRSASDYFPMDEGILWTYTNDDLYNPISINITIESADTILQRECYPFNASGEFRYYSKDREGIKEYIRLVKYYNGEDYVILQGFITRLELPLVTGNRFIDSLVDSLNFFGQWLKVRYIINGLVAEYIQDKTYGEVYKVITNRFHSVATQDSINQIEEYIVEYYAPGVGMVEFENDKGRFRLRDYYIK